MDTPPPGYVEPFWVYAVELTDESGNVNLGQLGAFTVKEEAEILLARLKAEGERARLNMIPVHERAVDYEFDR
jgi:hypothetical protein